MADFDLLDRMTNKVGPLPAWAWAAIPAAGYVVWSYYRASTTEDVPVTDTVPPDVADYGVNVGDPYLPSYGTIPDGSGNLPYTTPPEYNNTLWSRQAINFLVGQGVAASDAVTAINAYIHGIPSSINSTQMDALQRAITRFGPAPDGGFMPTVGTTPTPTPTPTKAPEAPTTVGATLSGTTVKVQWGAPQVTNGTIIGYKVEAVIKSANGTWQVKAQQLALPTARAATFTGLSHKTWYSFRVSARNSKGFGPTAAKSVFVP